MSWYFFLLTAKSYVVLALRLRSLLHFKLFFVYGLRSVQFYPSACGCPVSPEPSVERLLLFRWLVLVSLLGIGPVQEGVPSRPLCSLPWGVCICLYSHSCEGSFEVKKCESFHFILLFPGSLGDLGLRENLRILEGFWSVSAAEAVGFWERRRGMCRLLLEASSPEQNVKCPSAQPQAVFPWSTSLHKSSISWLNFFSNYFILDAV